MRYRGAILCGVIVSYSDVGAIKVFVVVYILNLTKAALFLVIILDTDSLADNLNTKTEETVQTDYNHQTNP